VFFSQQPTTFETPPHNGPRLCAESPRSDRRWVPTSKGGWIVRGRDLLGEERFQMYHPSTSVFVLTPPPNRGLLFTYSSMEARHLRGRACLALIGSCRQKKIAQNGFGQSWMGWPSCLQMRSRQRSMRETSHRREAAGGTQRKSSGCASAWPKVRGAKPGSDLWRAAVRLAQPVRRNSEDPPGMR